MISVFEEKISSMGRRLSEDRDPDKEIDSIYQLKKACHGKLAEKCNLLTPDQMVDRIFERVDENGD
ncbi:hypothetical protein F7725_001003, partial [Dissostichus mawsoni]